jgi:Undecaprenyl-phosphate glucose phosphotransferase
MIVNKRSIYILRLLSDLFLLNVAFLFAAVFSQSIDILISRYYMFFLLFGLNILWILLSNTSGFYDDFHSRNFPFQFVNILKETTAQVIASILFIFLAKEDLFTRNFIIIYTILGKNIRNLLIIGTGEVAYNFKNMISSNPDFGYHFTGFATEAENDDSANDVVGNADQLEKLISELSIDEVVIALKDKSDEFLDEMIIICNRNAVKTHIIPDYFKFVSSRFQVSMFGNFPIITARTEPLEEAHWRFFKRAFDIVFSLSVVVFIFSWLYPIIFILTKLSSPGPVFFIQDRVGSRNENFKCYKFRTMKVSENKSAYSFQPVVENDPRVTKVGRLLRKSNLDELPQFINVLKGEMSVVGPRPHAVLYDQKYGKIVDAIRLRHNVKPGITGWAQVHGLRGDVPDEEENIRRTRKRIEYDIWYIENWSMTLDFQIILITIWQMLKGKTRGV